MEREDFILQLVGSYVRTIGALFQQYENRKFNLVLYATHVTFKLHVPYVSFIARFDDRASMTSLNEIKTTGDMQSTLAQLYKKL